VRLEFAKIKGAKIILHAKSSTFRAAKLKGFTVIVVCFSGGGGNFVLSTSCVGYTPACGCVTPMCKDGYGFFYSIEPTR